MTLSQIFTFKKIGFLTPEMQIILICLFFVITIFVQLKEFRQTGKTWGGRYPLNTFTCLAAIYEEIIFRGFIFVALLSVYSAPIAIIVSSLLFGLWHLRSIFYISRNELIYQMIYTGLIFGPIVAYITLATGTIWLAVILHFCNNLLAGSPTFELKRIKK